MMHKREFIEFIDDAIYGTEKKLRNSNIDCANEQVALNDSLIELKLIKKYLYQLNEPEKPENPVVPKEFDEWYKEIQEEWSKHSDKQIALWKICQFGFGHALEDAQRNNISHSVLGEWVIGHKGEAIDAVLNGYTIEKEPVWIVKAPYDRYFGGFLEKGQHAEINFSHINRDNAQKFEDKSKAVAVATLVDGTVEEWSE